MEDERDSYLLLTGASSGIGKVMASILSKEYNIILNGRNEERLESTEKMCGKERKILIWTFDLNNINDIASTLSEFIEKNQIRISHFVHCAGYMKMLPLKMVTIDNISNTLNTNFISAVIIIKTLMQRKINNLAMKNIVFISSNISNMGAKALSVYGASKGALDSLMRCLAVELAPHVRVNSVLPGGVKTEMTESIYENEEVLKRMEATYPLGLGFPEDIAEAVVFLLSEKSRWITGQQITVDGGRTINVTA
ncbi:MAG: SDR family oxidoreductase [Bacteroidales bacterium]|jgi:NAD(P)-dependent dehydrogenase (short-subunit alcohol dehydrogenase family)|nr:SDR family oxidoreductase [Bacteroidales bacterium]